MSAQSNSYAKVVYFGVSCLDPLQQQWQQNLNSVTNQISLEIAVAVYGIK